MSAPPASLLISLHDVSPLTLPACEEAVALLGELGIARRDLTVLVIPYHEAQISLDAHGPTVRFVRALEDDGARLVRHLNQIDVRGANGDERGFNEVNHEGVVDDDVYFARFTRDFTFAPVKDDPLSATLPTISQTG